MVRTSPGVSGGGRRERGRIADVDHLGRKARQFFGNIVRQCLDVGRVTALPFVFVHFRRKFRLRGATPRWIILWATIYAANRARGRRCAHGCIPRGSPRDDVIAAIRQIQDFGGFFSRARFGSSAGHCTMWSSRSSSGISVLGALHPAAHGDAGLMHGVGIAGDQRVPPIEVASLGNELVAAARRQPVQGADVFRGQPDAVGNLVGAIWIVLAGAQPASSNLQETWVK